MCCQLVCQRARYVHYCGGAARLQPPSVSSSVFTACRPPSRSTSAGAVLCLCPPSPSPSGHPPSPATSQPSSLAVLLSASPAFAAAFAAFLLRRRLRRL